MTKKEMTQMRHPLNQCIWSLTWSLVVLVLAFCTQTAHGPSRTILVDAAPRTNITEVAIPIQAELDSYQVYARLFEAATVARTQFHRNDVIQVRWPDQLEQQGSVVIRIQTAQERIFLERSFAVTAGAVADLGVAYLIPAGDYDIVLMPTQGDYYLKDIRIQRKIAITLSP